MTTRQLRRAERLAAEIAITQCYCVSGPSVATVGGDRQRGWRAAFQSRRSIVGGQPPNTVEGWAGWLAAHIAWSPS